MATSTPTSSQRPRPLHTTRSFSRYEPPTQTTPTVRSRSSTIQNGILSPVVEPASPEQTAASRLPDAFEKLTPAADGQDEEPKEADHQLPEGFDDLPVEIASMTDRFAESLTAKVYNTPPSVDRLSDLFQDFYGRAAQQIDVHISTLALRLHRDNSPTPSRTSRSPSIAKSVSGLSLKSQRDAEPAPSGSHEQQMLTSTEVTQKRKARKLLEVKRGMLEEAVERRLCETVYDKIWRHRATLDEVQDEKLRSKTAALALVGVGVRELGIEVGELTAEKEQALDEGLAAAREALQGMSKEKYPLGKLLGLTNAHKAIVDTLSSIHPSSSSADEILPTLIYTLITSPLEGINIISNLSFIQRFRASTKVDGEAAYCMTNLEAAISFLENVDLSTLKADETPSGPKNGRSLSGSGPTPAPLAATPARSPSSTSLSSQAGLSPIDSSEAVTSVSSFRPPVVSSRSSPSLPTTQQRRLSNLLQPPTKAFEAASDTVRNTADNISNTLDNSFKFLFGRLKEAEANRTSSAGAIVLPKTLEEARRLVTPSSAEDIITAKASRASSFADHSNERPEDRLLSLMSGRKVLRREPSTDSFRSTGSKKSVAFTNTTSTNTTIDPLSTEPPLKETPATVTSNLASPAPPVLGSTPPNAAAALETVKNFGNTLNPLNHMPGMWRPFGSKAASPSPTPATSPGPNSAGALPFEKISSSPAAGTAGARAVSQPASSVSGGVSAPVAKGTIQPPIAKFVDVSDAEDLKMRDVRELLADYQRLVGEVRKMGGFVE